MSEGKASYTPNRKMRRAWSALQRRGIPPFEALEHVCQKFGMPLPIPDMGSSEDESDYMPVL